MTSPLILPLDSPEASLANAGGKAMNLTRLARAGLPVPPGFIITTDASGAFVAANDLGPFIQSTLATLSLHPPLAIDHSPSALEPASAAIRARFAASSLPPDLSTAILDAYHALPSPPFTIHHSPFTIPHSPLPVAVRSSATAEDLPDMSFAGQQDTVLGVVGDAQLLDAVIHCWSSLWTARAIAYRARNDIPHEAVAIAVVVQAMVESEASGVLFTANPLTGKRGETVIDATLGLGEALVSGQVEPDHYVVDVAAGRIVEKRLGAKARVIRSQPGGGTTMVEQEAASQQALPDASILQLASLGQQIQQELYAGQPQDIEWAWAGGQLHVLQSRPITSLYPLPAGMPAKPLQVLFSLNHVQGMLDPFTPLGQDALVLAYVSLARLFGKSFHPASQQEVWVAGERLYLNVSKLLRHPLGRRLARGILSAVEPGSRQALQPLLDDPRLVPGRRAISLAALGRLLRVLVPTWVRVGRALVKPEAQVRRSEQAIDALLDQMRAESRRATTPAQRLLVWDSLLPAFVDVAFPLLLPPLVAGIASFQALRILARRRLGSDQLALQAARAMPHNVTTEMDLTLWTVAQVIGADPDSAARFAAQDAATLAKELREQRLPPPAQFALAAFLDRYGMRGLAEIDIGRPRWQESPAPVIQAIQSYLRFDDPAQAPDVAFRRGAREGQAAIERLAKAMGGSPAGRLRARLVRFFGRRMRSLAGLRETPKFTIVRMMDIVRKDLLRSGHELVAAGLLDQPEDIFFLHYQELETLAEHGRLPSAARGATRQLVAQRQQAYLREMRRRQVPRMMLGDGTALYEGLGATGTAVMAGSPVSPGVAEGLVHVVLDPAGATLAPGEILVCPGTDPSWTPLFLAAGGLVMEVGGLMTHGSVVAREYGIPAVVGVHEATRRLKTGARVRVDGTAGIIALLEAEPM